MSQTANLQLSLKMTADGKDLKAEIVGARKEVEQLSQAFTGNSISADKATGSVKKYSTDSRAASRSTDNLTASVGRNSREFLTLRNALAGLSLGYISAQAVRMADDFHVLQQRIKTATRQTGDYNQVSAELFGITQNNGVALRTTVELFQGLARVAPELEANNQQMLELTNLVQQLGVISGATNTQMNNGLLQFTQGLAAGTFRAEEMNSILENLPELAVRIARGMNMTVGELRQAVLNGEVLSKDVFQSLINQADNINAQFTEIPLSVERAGTQLTNAVSQFVGKLDEGVGLSRSIAQALANAAESLNELVSGSPSVRTLEQELAALQARLDGGRFVGRSAKAQKQGLEARIAAVSDEILRAKAAAGNLAAIESLIQQTEKAMAALEDKRLTVGTGRNKRKTEYARLLEEHNNYLNLRAQAETQHAEEHRKAKEQAFIAELEADAAFYQEKTSALKEQQQKETELREKQVKRQLAGDQALLKSLEAEYKLLQLSDRERAIEIELRKLSANATETQKARVRELAGAMYDQQLAAEALANQADPFAEAWLTATERIDEIFADVWQGAFENFEEFADRLENGFKKLLAELAHQALTKPILVQLGLAGSGSPFGSTGINAGDLLSAGNSGGSLTDLLSGGGLLTGINGTLWSGVGYAADFLTNIGFNGAADTLVSAAANMGQLPGGLAGGSLLTAGGAYLGGKAGNAIGEGLFGKQAEHSYGQIAGGTIGGIAGAASGAIAGMQMGAWAGPVGALIGAALGALVDVAFGGDGKKRVSLGVHAADLNGGRYLRDTEIAASGLELTSMSRRVGSEGDQAARAMLDAFLLMDQTMVEAAETLGQTVDLAGVALKGKSSDAGHANGAFFGSAAYNRVDQSQIDKAAGEFVTAWGDAVGGQFDEVLDILTAGLSMTEISDHAGGIISAVGLVGSATGDLKRVLVRFVPTLDDTKTVASDLPFWFGQLHKTVSAFPFDDLILEGEVAATTLTRLSLNLVGANEVVDNLGMRVLELDEAGIRAADTLTGLFGGADAFAVAASNYSTAFMTESERFIVFEQGLRESFQALNAELPESRQKFRQLVESMDLADEAAQRQFAALIALVPVMEEYYRALEQQQQLVGRLESGIDSLIDGLYGTGSDIEQRIAEERSLLAEQQRAADALYRTEQQRYREALAAEQQLLAYADSLQLGELTVLTPEQQLAEAKTQFEAAIAAAKAGDNGAAQDATRIASSYLKIARDFYASSDAYRDIFLGVNRELNTVANAFGAATQPEPTTVAESDTLAALYAQLAEQQAQAAIDSRQEEAVELASQLAALGLARDVTVASLIDSFDINIQDLAEDFGVNFGSMSQEMETRLSALADTLSVSSEELLDLLTLSFGDLNGSLGDKLGVINDTSSNGFFDLGDIFNRRHDSLYDKVKDVIGVFDGSIDGLSVSMSEDIRYLAGELGVSSTELLELLRNSFGDLSGDFRDELGLMSSASVERLGDLAEVLQISSSDLLDMLGISFSDLAASFGIDIQNLDSSTAKELVELGNSLNLTNMELLGSLGLEIDDLGSDMKAELEALANALGLTTLDLLEGFNTSLAELAADFGIDLNDLDVSMTDELRALGDVFNLAIGSLAEELDINLAVLPVAIQEAVGYTPPSEPAAPAYDYDTWADWLAAGVADGWTPNFTEAYNAWIAENPVNIGWGNWSFYAKGGIANEPSIFGEAGPEAAVPLPDGRTIPVTLSYPPIAFAANDEMVAELKKIVRQSGDLQREINQLRQDNLTIANWASKQREGTKQAIEASDQNNVRALALNAKSEAIG